MAVELDLAQLHRLSAEEYHRILEAGGFDEDARVELLEGLLVSMSPKTRAHENAVAWLARWLMQAVDLGVFEVRVASPLTLADSEPEPDLAVIALNAPRPYHPATATLIIEVAVSSLRRDLGIKTGLYARAGVPEYWVLALDQRRLIVRRDVRPDVGEYAESIEWDEFARVGCAAVALPGLAIADVLAAANA
ncbi:MAG: Uma2 family endonuclease [Solirubrobacteraceae bacterium]